MPIPLIVPIALAAGSAISAGIGSAMKDYTKYRDRRKLWDQGSPMGGMMPGSVGASGTSYVHEEYKPNKTKQAFNTASSILSMGSTFTAALTGPKAPGVPDLGNTEKVAQTASNVATGVKAMQPLFNNTKAPGLSTSSIPPGMEGKQEALFSNVQKQLGNTYGDFETIDQWNKRHELGGIPMKPFNALKPIKPMKQDVLSRPTPGTNAFNTGHYLYDYDPLNIYK